MEYESATLRGVTGTTIRPGGLALTERAVESCRFTVGARLLDVGCGVGATVEYLRSRYGFAAAGVDLSQSLIAEGLARNPSLPLAEAAAEVLPIEDVTLDGIFCECVLSLMGKPHRVLREFHRALRSGGHLILSDMYDRAGDDREQMETWLSLGGFSVILWEDHTPLLKELAARLILAGGTPAEFCCTTGAGGRPGYYLLIARKD